MSNWEAGAAQGKLGTDQYLAGFALQGHDDTRSWMRGLCKQRDEERRRDRQMAVADSVSGAVQGRLGTDQCLEGFALQGHNDTRRSWMRGLFKERDRERRRDRQMAVADSVSGAAQGRLGTDQCLEGFALQGHDDTRSWMRGVV